MTSTFTLRTRTGKIGPRMKTSVAFFRALTLLLLAFVFCFTTYRAAVQAIAHDEAFTYLWFLDSGIEKVLMFDSNNHVLFTLLAKVIVKSFGITELSLRGASLVGCAGYLVAVFLLCKRLFGDSLLLPMTVAVLILNPTIMDFLAAARGYGLGVAFLTSAMYLLVCIAENETITIENVKCRRQCMIASAFLALSVAANLTNVIPAISLAASFFAVASWFPKQPVFGNGLRVLTQFFVIPGAIIGLFILWPFLIQARPQHFYVGYVRISDSARAIFNSSFLYKWTDELYATLGAVSPAPNSWQQRVSNIGAFVILPIFLLFLVCALILLLRTTRTSPSYSKSRAFLLVSAALGCVVLVLLLHFMAHVKYPLSRTALYVIPLFSISAIVMGSIVRDLCPDSKRPLLTSVGLVIMLAVIVDYAASLNKSYFRYNAYDRISRDLFFAITKDARPRRLADLRIGGTWWYEPEINFYRRRYNAIWLLPYDIKDPSVPFQARNSLTPPDYDYFVYTDKNKPDLTGRQVRVIFRDSATNLTAVAIDNMQ
jgi:hypothetical protein